VSKKKNNKLLVEIKCPSTDREQFQLESEELLLSHNLCSVHEFVSLT
jgi:hypothetical protein